MGKGKVQQSCFSMLLKSRFFFFKCLCFEFGSVASA